MSEAPRNYSGDRTFCCGQCMQKEWQQLLLIASYNSVYLEDYKIPIHSLWHAIEVLPQPSYVTSSCKSAIAALVFEVRTHCTLPFPHAYQVDPMGKRKVLAVTSINMVRYASSIPFDHDLHLRLKPVSRKIKNAILEVSINSVFLREGKAT